MRIAILASFLTVALCGFQNDKPKPLEADDVAPAFRLNDHTGNSVSIGGKQEKWTVLAFYPKAMTPG